MPSRDEPSRPQLSEDLQALDAELSSIRYEERPSFAPELAAELSRSWPSGPRGRRPLGSLAAAAALAGLLLLAVVPGARASIAKLLGSLRAEVPEQVVEPPPAPTPIEVAPIIPTPASLDFDEGEVVTSSPPVLEELSGGQVRAGGLAFPTSPRLVDRARAEALLQAAYPAELHEEGVGGTVEVRMWVDALGRGERVSMVRGSGVDALDRAALSVALDLDFEPALLGGRSVGTWIEFMIRFVPDEDAEPTQGRLDHRITP